MVAAGPGEALRSMEGILSLHRRWFLCLQPLHQPSIIVVMYEAVLQATTCYMCR